MNPNDTINTKPQTNQAPQKKNVDIVRLSQNILKNLNKEVQSGYQEESKKEQGTGIINDVKLTNKDQELNFGDGKDDDDEDDDHNNQENQNPEANQTDEDNSTTIENMNT